MSAVQVLRAKAQAAGNLKSGSQITVVQQSPQAIVIQSANPQVVYVPMYNPAVVYGYPYVTPGYSTAAVVATGVLAFGAGIAVGAMMSGGCCGWGYSSWNCGWHGTSAVVYHGGTYYGNNAWHGGYYGPADAYGAYGAAHYSAGYNPSTGTYARGARSRTAYGSVSAGQATTTGIRHPKGCSSVQPENRGLWRHRSRLQCEWELGELEWFRRTARPHTPSIKPPRKDLLGSVQTSSGGKGCWATGAYGNAAAVETPNGNKLRRRNSKR